MRENGGTRKGRHPCLLRRQGLGASGGRHRPRHRGRARMNWMLIFGLAVYNLVRIRNPAEVTG